MAVEIPAGTELSSQAKNLDGGSVHVHDHCRIVVGRAHVLINFGKVATVAVEIEDDDVGSEVSNRLDQRLGYGVVGHDLHRWLVNVQEADDPSGDEGLAARYQDLPSRRRDSV